MKIEIKKLTPERWADLAQLFKTSDQCKQCWCMNHRLNPKDEIIGTPAKEALKNLIIEKKAFGSLAYAGDQCIGWCAVDPIQNQPGHDYCLKLKKNNTKNVWSIHCLYLHPQFRGHGISKLLIKKAIEIAKAKRATQVLAFPIPEENKSKFPSHEAEFSGRYSTFVKLGFKKNEQLNDFYQVVSKNL